MKSNSGAQIQFSGYPLRLTQLTRMAKGKVAPALVIQAEKISLLKNRLADNPKNWDEAWFGNYE